MNKDQSDFAHQYPQLKYFRSSSIHYTPLQQQLLPLVFNTNHSLLVSAPSLTGKSLLFELSILDTIHKTRSPSQEACPIRCIFLAPSNSQCRAKLRLFSQSMNMDKLGLKAIVIDKDSEIDEKEVLGSNLIITNIEKFDWLTRNSHLNGTVDLLFINKVHMFLLGERDKSQSSTDRRRSNLFETAITRFLRSHKETRVVGLSLPLRNIAEIGSWLRIDKRYVVEYGEEYLLLDQNKVIYQIETRPSHKRDEATSGLLGKEKYLNQQLLNIINQYNSKTKHFPLTVIYCQSRRGSIATCSYLANELNNQTLITTDQQLRSLVDSSCMMEDKVFRQMITLGICFYSSSMNQRDQLWIQKLIKQGDIRIVCTSMCDFMEGVAVRGGLVIVKGVCGWRGSKEGYGEYSPLYFKEIMEKVGRVGVDSLGTLIALVDKGCKKNYNKLFESEDAQSVFHEYLKQNIVTEIALQRIRSLKDAANYLKDTFFYIRMNKNNRYYNFDRGDCYLFGQLEGIMKQLSKMGLMNFEKSQESVIPTRLSIQFSKSSVSFFTLKYLCQSSPTCSELSELVYFLCGTPEFMEFGVTQHKQESKTLRQLNCKNRFKVDEIQSFQQKVYVLIQASLSGYSMEEYHLNNQKLDILKVFKSILYIFRHVLKSKQLQYMYSSNNQSSRGNMFQITYYLVQLERYIRVRAWQYPQEQIIKHIPLLKPHSKSIHKNNIKTLQRLKQAIASKRLSHICDKYDNSIDQTVDDWMNTFRVDVELNVLEKVKTYLQIRFKFMGTERQKGSKRQENRKKSKRGESWQGYKVVIEDNGKVDVLSYKLDGKQMNSVYLKEWRLPLRVRVVYDNVIGFDQCFVIDESKTVIEEIGFQCYARMLYNTFGQKESLDKPEQCSTTGKKVNSEIVPSEEISKKRVHFKAGFGAGRGESCLKYFKKRPCENEEKKEWWKGGKERKNR